MNLVKRFRPLPVFYEDLIVGDKVRMKSVARSREGYFKSGKVYRVVETRRCTFTTPESCGECKSGFLCILLEYNSHNRAGACCCVLENMHGTVLRPKGW